MAQIHIDTSDTIKKLRRLHSSLSVAKFDGIVVQALNHTINKTKTRAAQDIRKIYGARSKDVKKGLRIDRATRMDPSATLVGFGLRLPLIAFSARQNKKGVSIKIKGKRRLINKAFIATMRSGHKGVFARGRYTKDGFNFRKRRTRLKGNDLEINELNTISVPGALSNAIIIKHLKTQMSEDFPNRLSHLLTRAVSR